MPELIKHIGQISPGDIYEDSFHHPCLCIGKEGQEVTGVSLVDGSFPRSENVDSSSIRKLTVAEAWAWRTRGPEGADVAAHQKWWQEPESQFVNPAKYLENLFFFALYQVEWHERIVARLGSPIRHEWHEVYFDIEDHGLTGKATIQFTVFGPRNSARVNVRAHKGSPDWLIDDLITEFEDKHDKIYLIREGAGVD